MRAFIAIELPEPVQAVLGQIQRELAKAKADVKWVEEGNLHLTMRFLGEIGQEQRRAIEPLLSRVAAATSPVHLRYSSLGAFPSVTSPRVVWVGLEAGPGVLAPFADRLEEGVVELGFPHEERAFTAHVTLGRVRSPRNRAGLANQLNAFVWSAPPAPFVATHLTLFHSILSPAGPTYAPLARFPFSSG